MQLSVLATSTFIPLKKGLMPLEGVELYMISSFMNMCAKVLLWPIIYRDKILHIRFQSYKLHMTIIIEFIRNANWGK